MDVEVVGDLGFESAQEGQELPCAVARKALPDDLAGGDVQGREERGGPVAHVVVGTSLDLSGPHGEKRTGAVQRLDLALLVHTQHQGPFRRAQIEPDDVSHLLHKQRVR